MKIFYLERVDSTQSYLKKSLQSKKLHSPCAVVAEVQTAGVGSRDNRWEGLNGNLFLSFSLALHTLPSDLKLESASIYFAYILKETLSSLGSSVWLKWPNDFYLNTQKIGGMITNVVGEDIVCGVGLNLKNAPDGYSVLDIKVEKNILLDRYFQNLENFFLWKQVFSKYKLEFYLNENYSAHVQTQNKNEKICLGQAILEDDGSLIINGQRIYSLR